METPSKRPKRPLDDTPCGQPVNPGLLAAARALAPPRPCYIRADAPQQSFFFGYFWFSHRTGGGEASA
jgi:hypothetical protein